MALPSRAVEDAIWSMGPDEIASRANHQPFLLEKGMARSSGSPPSSTALPAGQTPTPTTPGGFGGKGGEELGRRRRRTSSVVGRRSRTQSTSLGGGSGISLPPLREGAYGDAGRRPIKSEGEESEQDRESGRDSETDRERRGWYGQVANKADSPLAQTSSRDTEMA